MGGKQEGLRDKYHSKTFLVSFSVAIVKQPNKINLKRERVYFGWDFQSDVTHHGGEEMTMAGTGS